MHYETFFMNFGISVYVCMLYVLEIKRESSIEIARVFMGLPCPAF